MTPDHCYDAKILRVIDADTYEVEVDLGFRMRAHLPLRLAHVDAPERFTEEGRLAIQAVVDLFGRLPSSVVVHTYKPIDKFGRYLADVLVGDVSVAQLLLSKSLATAYEGGKKS